MMRIDTSNVPGWEDRTVVLEFSHPTQRLGDLPAARWTEARLVLARKERPGYTYGWRCTPSGWWKKTLRTGRARCSNDDQFCRETGRRIAVRRLAEAGSLTVQEREGEIPDDEYRLLKAALDQYFADRAARRRAA